MSLRVYFVLSFGLFTVVCAVLTVNWWTVTQELDAPWRYLLPVFGAVMTLWSGFHTLEAAIARYR